MKVILTQRVKKIGDVGDVVRVADGYARNYLIPRGLAVEATAANLKEAEKAKERQAQKEARGGRSQELAARLKERVIVLEGKAGEGGRLFGSITGQDIAQAIEAELGTKVDKRKVELKEPLKALGDYKVPVRLYKDYVVEVAVQVVEGEK